VKPEPGEPGYAPPTRASYRSGFSFGTLSFLGTAALGLVSTILTSRIYGITVIGEFALASAPTLALYVFSTVKEQQALIREITGLEPRDPRVTQLFAVVFSFSWALTAIVAALDALVCWFVFRGPLGAPGLLGPAFALIAGYVVVSNTGWNIDSVLSAFIAARELFWVRLCETLSFIAFAVAAGLAWGSVWGLVGATIGAALLALLVRAVAVRPYLRARLSLAEYRRGFEVLPDLLRFGIKATPGQIAQGVSQQGGIWALGFVASPAVVGAYSRALSLPQRLQQASLRITEVLYPTLVGRHSRGDGHGFDRALVDSIRYEVIGMALFAAAIGGAAHSVLDVFGSGFARATPALALLAIYPALASVTVAQTQALWAVDRPGLTSLISLARTALTLVALVVLTPAIGMVGAAIALVSGYLAGVVLSGWSLRPYLARGLRVTWPRRERLALLLAYGAGFAAAHGLERLIPSTPGVVICVSGGAGAYALVFLLCGGLNSRDRRRLAEALGWLRERLGRGSAGRAPSADPTVLAAADGPGRDAGDDLKGGDGAGDHGARPDHGAAPDPDPGGDDGVGAEPDVVLDHNRG
jgi:O-antigen/teichoic acid export membrane protein